MVNHTNRKIVLSLLSISFFLFGVGMSHIPDTLFHENVSILAVVLLATPAFLGFYKIYGKRGALCVILLSVWALLIETVGIHTGFPYSNFEYTFNFGYRLFGTTPWTVFFAWSPLVIGAFICSELLAEYRWLRFCGYLSILIAVDLVLDPGAVARGLWRYMNGGIWFDVPLQNFIGWIFSGIIAYIIIYYVLGKSNAVNDQYIWVGVTSLLISVCMWTGVTFGYGLYVPAFLGVCLGQFLIKVSSDGKKS